MTTSKSSGLLHRLQERGVLRVAASYAVIAWLLLQVADVILDPLGLPKWVMTALIVVAIIGFPIATALAWFLEVGDHGARLDTTGEDSRRPATRGIRHYADAVVIAVLLIAVAVLLVREADLGKPKAPENPAIAVLPFENLSGDPEQEYFSDGLAEEMLDRLGRVPGLRVIARSSSFSFKGKEVDAKTVAERLGVTTVLEGSVRRDGRRLKLTARLIDGATGQQAWSGSFDREVTDVFAVQAELAAAIVNAIVPAARGEALAEVAAPPTDLDAYDLYLLARTQAAIRTKASIRKSVELTEQAVRLDPKFARAHAHLAASLLLLRLFEEETATAEQRDSWLRAAEASIHRALALDANLSEAHDARANLLRDTGRPGAEEEYKRALKSNPNNAAAWHNYSVFLSHLPDRQLEVKQATERALQLDPRQPAAWANYINNFAYTDRDRYRSEFARVAQMIGDMPNALERLAGPQAVIAGFPVQIMIAGLARLRSDAGNTLPAWLSSYRAWAGVDATRARLAVEGQGGIRFGVDFANVAAFLHAEATALLGEWDALDNEIKELEAIYGAANPHVRTFEAFWLVMQGRDQEAVSLGLQEPTSSEHGIPPMLSNSHEFGLVDVARVRLYRASGREQDATRHVTEILGRLRAQRRAPEAKCGDILWMQYAALAANEGLKDEAVDALGKALHCGDLPLSFQPQLPWFRKLAGYPPYDALVRERARRVELIRAELMRLEKEAGTHAQG